jgi:predicted RNA binding protein with dsRBD fold (UPF0201 family)
MNFLKVAQMLGVKITDEEVAQAKQKAIQIAQKAEETYERLKRIEELLLNQRCQCGKRTELTVVKDESHG